MKKIYFSFLACYFSINLTSQTIVFSEDFQSVSVPTVVTNIVSPPTTIYGGDIPGGWAQVNVDGYSQLASTSTTSNDYSTFMGSFGFRVIDNSIDKAAFTRSRPNNVGVSTSTDDILRTPQITLPTSLGITELSFKLISTNIDSVKVFISTSPTLLSNATLIYTKYGSFPTVFNITANVDISAFDGQPVYIFFEAFDKVSLSSTSSNAGGSLYIDNVKVTTDIAASVKKNKSDIQIVIGPNPCSTDLYISSIGDKNISQILISNLNGQIIKKVELNLLYDSRLDVSNLQSGIYFLNIINNNVNRTYKFIKS